ncbi:FAD-dependent oxidoreductase, partial [Methylobacterium trifolii]
MASRLSSPIGLRRDSPAHDSAASLPERADVAIVGGGLIGLSIAWRLAQAGRSVAVIERGTLGS